MTFPKTTETTHFIIFHKIQKAFLVWIPSENKPAWTNKDSNAKRFPDENTANAYIKDHDLNDCIIIKVQISKALTSMEYSDTDLEKLIDEILNDEVKFYNLIRNIAATKYQVSPKDVTMGMISEQLDIIKEKAEQLRDKQTRSR